MNIEQAVIALHATKLPRLRQRHLTLEAAHAPSDAARSLLVARALHEARTSQEAHSEAVRADLLARWKNAQEREGYEPPPVTPTERPREFPETRPVVVTWTTPRKPDLIRPERRAEVVGANRRVRAKAKKMPEPNAMAEEIPRAVEVVEPEPATPKRGYGDKPPVNLPAGKRHGYTSYVNYKCRCHVCREGKRLNRTNQGIKAPRGTIPQHGTTTGYTRLKCRDDCPGHPATGKTCRESMTEWARERRAKKALE